MMPSWFIAKNTVPTLSAMQTVRLRLCGDRTTATASRRLCQEFGFIAASSSGAREKPRNVRTEIRPYTYGIRLDAELGRPADQFGLGLDAELDVHGGEVALHRALAEEQPLGDLGRGLSAGGQQGDLALPPAQGIDPQRRPPSRPALAPGEEDLDLVRDRVDVAEPGPVIGTGQLDVGSRGEVGRDVPGVADVDPGVTAAVQHQRRQPDAGEDVADVQG